MIISREDVHKHSEACIEMGEAFQSVAQRLHKEQRRLLSHLEKEFASFDPTSGHIAVYMATVSARVFEQMGTRLKKVTSEDIETAEKVVKSQLAQLLPVDDDFPNRAKTLQRSQPHLMDEILWALYDRGPTEENSEPPVLDSKRTAKLYLLLWVAVEALHSKWTP